MSEPQHRDRHHHQPEVAPRGSAACSNCRSKKQKCDGVRPVCGRCGSLGQGCSWPEKKKRGPAKGYNEALQMRLAETETVLRTLLGSLPPEQLACLLDETSWPSVDLEPPRILLAEDRKLAVEHWARFPLRSAGDVRSWLAEDVSGDDAHLPGFGAGSGGSHAVLSADGHGFHDEEMSGHMSDNYVNDGMVSDMSRDAVPRSPVVFDISDDFKSKFMW